MTKKRKKVPRRSLEMQYAKLRVKLSSIMGWEFPEHRFPATPDKITKALIGDLQSTIDVCEKRAKELEERRDREARAREERASYPDRYGVARLPERKPRMVIANLTDAMIGAALTYADMWQQMLDVDVWMSKISNEAHAEFLLDSLNCQTIALDIYQHTYPAQVVCLRSDGRETSFYELRTTYGACSVCIFCRAVICQNRDPKARTITAAQERESRIHGMTCVMHVVTGALQKAERMKHGPPLGVAMI